MTTAIETGNAVKPKSPSGFKFWLKLLMYVALAGLALMVVMGLLGFFFGEKSEKVLDKTALVLNWKGPIVEQHSGNARTRLLAQLEGGDVSETQLRDVILVLDAAAKDSNINSVVLALEDFGGAGLASLKEVNAALARFKATGKKVVAFSSNYTQRQYFVAAQADEVYLHPMGMVYIEGYGRLRNYYKDALDRLGVQANVIRVGKFKNFGEPYFATGPSEATTKSDAFLYDALWSNYTTAVEKARKLPDGSIVAGIEALPERLAAANGSAAKMALAAKLVDGLKTRDEFRDIMIARGAKDTEKGTFRQVSFNGYLRTLDRKSGRNNAVGIIVAEGDIVDGEAPQGSVGGRSTSELIRKAREDKRIKALVLRVNSPGGSAFASELIRRELELTRTAGKPVVISMGDVAASGGYWVAMSADEIIADASTITGSIGVFSILPTGEKAMEKLSVATSGYTTTWLGKAYDPRTGLDPRFASVVQATISNIYSEFTERAAKARKTTVEKIDDVAQGRVWTGTQAKERNLIDRTGSFKDAIKSAAFKAKLAEDAPLTYVEKPQSPLEKLLAQLGGAQLQAAALRFQLSLLPAPLPVQTKLEVQQDLQFLAGLANRAPGDLPFVAMTHCLCGK